MEEYRGLFSRGAIGGLEIQNRIVMPAMGTALGGFDGRVTDDMIEYYRARAMSGPGIIVVEVACVDAPAGRALLNQIRIDHQRYLSGLSRLAEALKSGGSRAFIQLHHAGRQTNTLITDGIQPVAPSALPCRVSGSKPREATAEDIEDIKKKFIMAGVFAKQAGFDGVEIHAAHGYLLSGFLSPFTNRRTDGYGGSTGNRARIVVEIIGGIRSWCGGGLVIGIRFNMKDFLTGGIEEDEGEAIAGILEKAGADYLSVSSGMYESGHVSIEPQSFGEGWRLGLAERVKKSAGIPVFGGGVIRHPDFAEKAIAGGKADFLFVGRNQIADEKWAEKARKGQADKIRPCLSCNHCLDRTTKSLHIGCAVNPHAGRELRLGKLLRADYPGRILVVGGGPGGMWSAVLLSGMGHAVTLVESRPQLGGMLVPGSRPPHKERIGEFREYLVGRLRESGTRVLLDTVLDGKLIKELSPHAAVIATGGRPRTLPVLSGASRVIDSADLLMDGETVTGRTAVVIGGGSTGCEAAAYLAKLGNEVHLLEVAEDLAAGMEILNRMSLVLSLRKAGVKIYTGAVISGAEGYEIRFKNKSGDAEKITADIIVSSLGIEPDRSAADLAEGSVKNVFVIGDAGRPGSIAAALYDAEIAARRIQAVEF
jgi:2,4-dienoyl-CoA reductase-like NADH-dependent reductase (Old Yellow Enzyme family)/thioredoxin reductase